MTSLSAESSRFASLIPAGCAEAAGEFGHVLRLSAEANFSRHVFDLPALEGVSRFMALHRYEPFWMLPETGISLANVPTETQFLLVEFSDGHYGILVPLVDGSFRMCLEGSGVGLRVIAESGDLSVVANSVSALYFAEGADPYQLISSSAKSVALYLSIPLSSEKKTPEFTKWFGWCTWDAFYAEVSHDKVREGLQSFQDAGVPPRYLILDDGWQSVKEHPAGGNRLSAFAANSKFPGDLAPTIQMAKQEFKIQNFLVWHALPGYWGGVDADSFPQYDVISQPRNFSPGILSHRPTINDWWGSTVGLVRPKEIHRFYQDYHRHLAKQGVDGVKVDVQASLEGVASGQGGRVSLMQTYREALEGSVAVHFGGNLINCMSCASEMLYSARASNLVRTSTDFWPNDPSSHGLHLYTNAMVSLWFGNFIAPDWDMFQSGHVMGAYHAAGRAVGGVPVYVSDKPGLHGVEILKKLVLPDGRLLPTPLGMPSPDTLFSNPTREEALLKIYSGNSLLGVFNARASESEMPPTVGEIGIGDLPGLAGKKCAFYAHEARELRVLDSTETWTISLAPLTFEVFAVSEVIEGFAAIGRTSMYNAPGAISSQLRHGSAVEMHFEGGPFLAYSENQPNAVLWNEETISFTYDPSTSSLVVTPEDHPGILKILFS